MYQIINGKLFKDGKQVNPLIGDIEQIKVLNDANRRAEGFINGLDVAVESHQTGWTHDLWFKCVCGKSVIISVDSDDEYPSDLDGKVRSCYHCKTTYIASEGEGDMFKIKIKK
jgi:hypothetical protein